VTKGNGDGEEDEENMWEASTEQFNEDNSHDTPEILGHAIDGSRNYQPMRMTGKTTRTTACSH